MKRLVSLLCALCLFFFYVLIINATRPHADIQRAHPQKQLLIDG